MASTRTTLLRSAAVLVAAAVVAVTPATAHASRGPSLYGQIQRYLATRHGSVAVAVYDRVAHTTMILHPGLRGWTASIVKVDILETLLHRTRGHLTSQQRSLARGMIEDSDNGDAQTLWDEDGGAHGLDAYDRRIGLTGTRPNQAGHWGLTTTTAQDQVTLVETLLHRSSALTSASRRYARRLMTHVTTSQRWGISGGVPPHGTRIGLKDGWLPVSEDHGRWAVNSIGFVSGHHSSYVVAVITEHDPDEEYGIDTIEHISRLVWGDVATS